VNSNSINKNVNSKILGRRKNYFSSPAPENDFVGAGETLTCP
jgi:hypothetical protein